MNAVANRVLHPKLLLGALLPYALAWAGCAGSLEEPEMFMPRADAGSPVEATVEAAAAPSCPDVPTLFAKTCGTTGCHDATTKIESLDLVSPGLASRLVGVPSVEGVGLLIDPSTPSKSVLYTKLLPNVPFGARMPAGGSLDANTIQCALAWITSEATPAPAGSGDAGDGAIASDDGAPTFCAGSTHTFCADFDEPDPDGSVLAGGWDKVEEQGGGVVTISTERARSGTRSLKTTIPRQTTTATASANLVRIFPGWGHFRLEFDVWVVAPAWQSGDVNFGMASVGFFSSGAQQAMDLTFAQQYSVYSVGAGTSQLGALPTDAWFHASFDVQPSGSSTANVGGIEYSVTANPVSPGGQPVTWVFMGLIGYNAPSPEVVAYFDNVVVDQW
jgi:hypothetical protein